MLRSGNHCNPFAFVETAILIDWAFDRESLTVSVGAHTDDDCRENFMSADQTGPVPPGQSDSERKCARCGSSELKLLMTGVRVFRHGEMILYRCKACNFVTSCEVSRDAREI